MAINGNESSTMSRQAEPTSPRHEGGDAASVAHVARSTNDDAASGPLRRDDSPQQRQHDEEPERTAATRSDREDAANGEEEICVRVKFLHREDPIALRCAPSISIADLKQRVRAVYESLEHHDHDGAQTDTTPPSAAASPSNQPPSSGSAASTEASRSLRLIYKGKVLKDDHALASYAYVSEDTIHAVFSRPSTSFPPSSTESADTTTANNATSAATSTTTPTPTPPTHGVASMTSQDLGNGVFVSRINIDTDSDTPLPDIGRLINTVISSAMSGFGGDVPITTTVHLSSTSERPASTSTPTPSTHQDVGSAPATPAPSQPAPSPQAAAPTPQPSRPASGAAALQNEAASIRRRIPALELTSMARPPNLSPDLYELGNALREASDTYLAIHRQLQFLSSRILNEPNLDRSERARLRTRSHMLVPVLEDVAQMSRSIASQLSHSFNASNSSREEAGAGPTDRPTSNSTPIASPPAQASASSMPLPRPMLLPHELLLRNFVSFLPGADHERQQTSTPTAEGNPPSARPDQPNTPSILDVVAALALGTQDRAANQASTSTETTEASTSATSPDAVDQVSPAAMSDSNTVSEDRAADAEPSASSDSS